MKKIFYLITFIILIAITGCGTPYASIVQIGSNKYTTSGASRNSEYKYASNFCKSKGMLLKPIKEASIDKHRNISLDFQCFHAQSIEYSKNNSYEVNNADLTIQSDIKLEVK